MKADKSLSTSDSLKDHLQAILPTLFMKDGAKPKYKGITVQVSWDDVSLSEAANTRLDADEKKQALDSALSKDEQTALASLQARVKAAESVLGKRLAETRAKDSRVSVKGLQVSKVSVSKA